MIRVSIGEWAMFAADRKKLAKAHRSKTVQGYLVETSANSTTPPQLVFRITKSFTTYYLK